MIEYFLYPTDNAIGSDGGETGVIAPMTGAVAINATGTAVNLVRLYGILLGLVIPHKTGIGVSSPPDAHHGSSCE